MKASGYRDSVMHSAWNSLSSSGRLLHSVSTVWTVESLLELEHEVDSCCVVVWCIAERALLL